MQKNFVIMLFICGFWGILNAQKITYHYDASGNRTDRIIEYGSQPQQSKKQADPIRYEDSLFEDSKVTIYPNPTEGLVTVELQNYDAEITGSISITTTGGRLLQQAGISGALTPLDISSQPDGLYLFMIEINGEISTWKIIKK